MSFGTRRHHVRSPVANSGKHLSTAILTNDPILSLIEGPGFKHEDAGF
jgi:hypothetical protein